jgi:trimethylamine--corrinoid protein Co-methyltransferase
MIHPNFVKKPIKILDLESGRARPTTLNDMYQIGRLVDGLDNIHFLLRPCIPTDIPENEYDANTFYTCLKATGKHVMAGVNDVAGFHKALDIAAMVAGDMAKLKGKRHGKIDSIPGIHYLRNLKK